MRIAIYSRGLEITQREEIGLLLQELKKQNVEPVFFQDFLTSFILQLTLKAVTLPLTPAPIWMTV